MTTDVPADIKEQSFELKEEPITQVSCGRRILGAICGLVVAILVGYNVVFSAASDIPNYHGLEVVMMVVFVLGAALIVGPIAGAIVAGSVSKRLFAKDDNRLWPVLLGSAASGLVILPFALFAAWMLTPFKP